MAFCKVCDCGYKIVFPGRSSFPPNCPSCGRSTLLYEIFDENDPAVEERLRQVGTVNGSGAASGDVSGAGAENGFGGGANSGFGSGTGAAGLGSDLFGSGQPSGHPGAQPSSQPSGYPNAQPEQSFGEINTARNSSKYALRLPNGIEIPIPQGGCIIGRTEDGGEELADYPSVSRQHARFTPRGHSGVLIEDLSTYGTWVDGTKLEKNMPFRARPGATIVLCNLETTLVKVD